ncbi:MAG: TonB-dependent receptor [Burkholderiales bacterium]|nr:TonB-dependent receptor [Burkholderiales bacterium]
MKKSLLATLVALSTLISTHAQAQDEEKEIEELRQRVRELEDRLDQQATSTNTQAVTSNTRVPTGNTYNPAISLIINAKYGDLELDPDTYEIGGFVPSNGHGGEDGHGHGAGPGERGFSLDESELTISANIDPYWLGYLTVAIADGEVEVEEGYIQNSGYLPGLVAKAGRFFSGIGYANQQHPHAWDFADAPLVQQAFLGTNLGEDGIQLRYVAPTPLFLEFGAEAGRGVQFPGSERNKNGVGAGAAFVHVGGDIGFSNSYQIGSSYRETTATEREYDDVDSSGAEIENIFSDLKSKTWGVDFVWKWAPNGDPSIRNFKFQAEYFRRKEDGQLGYDFDDVTGAFAQEGPYSRTQSGWYAQAVWQFVPRWRVGFRYDQLDSGTLEYGPIRDGSLLRDDLQLLRENKPKRSTVMVDFSTSEFARFRLQFAQDKARFNETDNQLIFQYVVSLGAHGAHKF